MFYSGAVGIRLLKMHKWCIYLWGAEKKQRGKWNKMLLFAPKSERREYKCSEPLIRKDRHLMVKKEINRIQQSSE